MLYAIYTSIYLINEELQWHILILLGHIPVTICKVVFGAVGASYVLMLSTGPRMGQVES